MSHMFSDIHADESGVADGFSIFRLCPSERNSSVAQLNVDVPDWLPFVQYEGSVPSNPPIEVKVRGWPSAPVAVNRTSNRTPVNSVCLFITTLPS